MCCAADAPQGPTMSFLQLSNPSFRSRLRLFFVVIVVVPMITMAVVLYHLIAASQSSQTDAALSTSETVSSGIYEEEQGQAAQVAQQVGSDQQLADALAAEERRAVQSRLDALAERTGARYVKVQVDGKGAFESGSLPALASSTRRLVDEQQRPTGEITVAMLSPDEYARRIAGLTGSQVVIDAGADRLASTQPEAARDLPDDGAVEVAGVDYRVASFRTDGVGGKVDVTLLMPDRDTASPTSGESILAAAAFFGFLALAFAFAVAVSRRLQSEIQRLLVAAQRLGRGDFSVEVPADGDDEFAALGQEFNSMARQLQARLEEL
jgi:HAMP domain-containing protein